MSCDTKECQCGCDKELEAEALAAPTPEQAELAQNAKNARFNFWLFTSLTIGVCVYAYVLIHFNLK